MGFSFKDMTIAGCAIAVSAGALLYWFAHKKPKDNMNRVEILSKESFIELCQNIRSHYSSNYWPAVKASRIERRKYSSRSKNYEQAIINFQKQTRAFLDDAIEQVTKNYRISPKIFKDSVNYYQSVPEIAQYSEDIVKPVSTEEIKSNLTRDKVQEFMTYYSKRFDELKNDDPDFDEYLILTNRIEDELYEKYGIEVEELDHEYEKYKIELEDIVEPMKMQTSYILASADDSFED